MNTVVKHLLTAVLYLLCGAAYMGLLLLSLRGWPPLSTLLHVYMYTVAFIIVITCPASICGGMSIYYVINAVREHREQRDAALSYCPGRGGY